MRVRLLVVPILAVALPAQSELTFHPGVDDATSRSSLGPAAGDLVTHIDSDFFAGVGTTDATGNSMGEVHGFTALIQDQDASTLDAYTFVVRVGEDPAQPGTGIPDPASSAEVARTGILMLPPGPPGPAAFQVSGMLMTPAQVLPARDDWYFGVGVAANGSWTADGLANQMASYGGLGMPFPQTHDNPRTGAPNLAFYVDTDNGSSAIAADRVWHSGIIVSGPVLTPGADIVAGAQTSPNPCFGAAGFFPDSSGNGGRAAYQQRNGANDGLAFRVRQIDNPGGASLIVAGIGFSNGVPYASCDGFLWLDHANPILSLASVGAIGFLDINGEAIIPGLVPSPLVQGLFPKIAGQISFSAINVASPFKASSYLSNAVKVDFL